MTISKLPALNTHIPADPLNRTGAARASPQSAALGEQQAHLKLSPLAEKLKALAHDYASNTPFDEKRVEALRSAIAAGTFKVDADAVASKLIASAQEILGRKAG